MADTNPLLNFLQYKWNYLKFLTPQPPTPQKKQQIYSRNRT